MHRCIAFTVLCIGVSSQFDQRLNVFYKQGDRSEVKRCGAFQVNFIYLYPITLVEKKDCCDSFIPLGGTMMHSLHVICFDGSICIEMHH